MASRASCANDEGSSTTVARVYVSPTSAISNLALREVTPQSSSPPVFRKAPNNGASTGNRTLPLGPTPQHRRRRGSTTSEEMMPCKTSSSNSLRAARCLLSSASSLRSSTTTINFF